MDDPLFVGNKMEIQTCEMMKFGGKSCEVANKKSVTSNLIKTNPKARFTMLITSGSSLIMFRRKNAQKQSV